MSACAPPPEGGIPYFMPEGGGSAEEKEEVDRQPAISHYSPSVLTNMKKLQDIGPRCFAACSRRRFIQAAALAALGVSAAESNAAKVTPAGAFDGKIIEFMEDRRIPGAALAVVKDGRLVHARGFGWADKEKEIRATPASLFRIASISKPITAVAILRLLEQKKLSLDSAAFELAAVPASNEAKSDERLKRISLLQLLQHTAGWDRDKSYDPMFRSREIASDLSVPSPAMPRHIIRYMLGQPLDFDPGDRYAYSNFGYCVLGRIIEKVAGQPYEQFVRDEILKPLGIASMRIGASLEAGRADGEACYYMPGERSAKSVFDTCPGEVPWPYGGFCLESMDAHGGWIASAVDLARFAAAFDASARQRVLKPETMAVMTAPPPAPVSRRPDGTVEAHYYGCGWSVRPKSEGRFNLWHTGSLPGTYTLLVRRADRICYAMLFNQRSDNSRERDREIDPILYRAADSVTDWPKEDLFGQFPSG